jgi:hypothetical protein
VIEADPRRDEGRKQPLQVKIPPEVHSAFSAIAIACPHADMRAWRAESASALDLNIVSKISMVV